jgi:hypothetical protein
MKLVASVLEPSSALAAIMTRAPRVKFDSHWNREKLSIVVFVQGGKEPKDSGCSLNGYHSSKRKSPNRHYVE